ncbi:MAG TPA: hypothetical protein VMR66_02180 [Gemmatimonadota bacterium]|nr:hypothetical protein [Gemmatimonadota bacterium]
MTTRLDPERELRTLGAAERRRRRLGMLWTVAAICAAFAFGVLVWESLMPGAGLARAAGYATAALLAGGGLAWAWRRWPAPAPGARAVAARLERLFPQARGRVVASLERADGGLPGARVSGGRAWLARRGADRLDRALSDLALHRLGLARRSALVLATLALLAGLAEPAAARRVVRAVLDPTTLWREDAGLWRVVPGEIEIEYGADVDGAVAYTGPVAEGPLVLEWREGSRGWQADTLGTAREGTWRWPDLVVERRYRLRYGTAASPEYALAVRPPLALVRAEARAGGEAWQPLAGRTTTAGEGLEIRGEASGPLAAASVIDAAGREVPLAVAGGSFRGPVSDLAPGPARLLARGSGGQVLEGPTFAVAVPGAAFVEILRPVDDPARLAAEAIWLEARAGAPEGLASLSWETGDGRGGRLAAVGGARDTIVSAPVPLAAGRMPGETVRYRVVARPTSGAAVATPWRSVVLASEAALRAAAAEERAAAGEEMRSALEAARRASEEREAPGRPEASEAAAELDRRLASAADSLARALDRTLADPGLDPDLAAQLEGYRRQLEGVATAELDPPRGRPSDPADSAEARAAVLEAIAERLARIERSLERVLAADSLESLADAQSALADETAGTRSEELESRVAERQAALSDAAREMAERLSESARAGIEDALERVAGEIEAGDPAEAAAAQRDAAAEMSEAAGQTRGEESGGGQTRSHGAALDRAGAESLFLAGRQRELAEREGRLDDPGERAARLARQRVVTGGLERALGTMVEAIGGRPAGMELGMRMAQAVYLTRRAEEAAERSAAGPGGAAAVRGAAEDAATALALLARGLFLPEGGGGEGGGAGQASDSGPLTDQLQRMAAAQSAMADALAGAEEPAGGNPEAAAAQRSAADELRGMGPSLEEEGVDARSVEALARAIESASSRLERGLAGARTESELRTLARRLSDLGRMVDRENSERRRSETARSFVPADPDPLEERVTAPVLDPAAALAAWAGALPVEMLGPARRYLERLANEGVRSAEGRP